jgi:hypothetical protein
VKREYAVAFGGKGGGLAGHGKGGFSSKSGNAVGNHDYWLFVIGYSLLDS